MTDKTLCLTPDRCGSLLGEKENCGHKVLYGPGACWRKFGNPGREIGEAHGAGWKSPFRHDEGEVRE